jgi:RNA polymerase sigma-70 factor (ECF subfamily)
VFQDTAPPDYEPATRVTLDVGIALRQAMGKLAPMEWEILLLREYEELSYAEIATVLQIPLNTVRSRLFRARMQMRELLTSPPARTATRESSTRKEHA